MTAVCPSQATAQRRASRATNQVRVFDKTQCAFRRHCAVGHSAVENEVYACGKLGKAQIFSLVD